MTGFFNPELLNIGARAGIDSDVPADAVILGRGEVSRSRPPKHSDYVAGEPVFRTGWLYSREGQSVSVDFSAESPVKAQRFYVRTKDTMLRIDRCDSAMKSLTNGHAVVTHLEASKQEGRVVSQELPLKDIMLYIGEDVESVVAEDVTLATNRDLDWLDIMMISHIDTARDFDSALEALEAPAIGQSAAD